MPSNNVERSDVERSCGRDGASQGLKPVRAGEARPDLRNRARGRSRDSNRHAAGRLDHPPDRDRAPQTQRDEGCRRDIDQPELLLPFHFPPRLGFSEHQQFNATGHLSWIDRGPGDGRGRAPGLGCSRCCEGCPAARRYIMRLRPGNRRRWCCGFSGPGGALARCLRARGDFLARSRYQRSFSCGFLVVLVCHVCLSCLFVVLVCHACSSRLFVTIRA